MSMSFGAMMTLEPHGPDTYVASGPQYPWGGLYGGQIIAQALRAATLTVDPAFRLHSLHAYFIRLGDAAEPIRLEVDRIKSNRSQTAATIPDFEQQVTIAENTLSLLLRRTPGPIDRAGSTDAPLI